MKRERTMVIAGGSGFLGRSVAKFMLARGWRVVVLSRRADVPMDGVQVYGWDGRSIGAWAGAIEGADVVLNLAGKSVNCRYHARNRAEIERSRVQSTKILGEAIAAARERPRVWINSSTATIYRHAEDGPQDEYKGEIGAGFSVNVAKAWEKAFFDAPAPGVRKVAIRTAMVMGRGSGGPFEVFLTLVKMRLGGRMGSGRQFVSWVHVEDFCRALDFLIEHEEIEGIVNIASPLPLRNDQFMRELRRAANVKIGLPAFRWMLEIGALLIRTETELPLKSRYVVSTRLIENGFAFEHADWAGAAKDLVKN